MISDVEKYFLLKQDVFLQEQQREIDNLRQTVNHTKSYYKEQIEEIEEIIKTYPTVELIKYHFDKWR